MANQTTTAAAPNPLDQLRDIHLPEPVSSWPMAPGWWLLIIVGCLLTGWLIVVLYRRHSATLYRRQALAQLKRLEHVEHLEHLEQKPLTGNSQQQLRALFELLKQTANSAYPDRHPGSYSIDAFIRFLQYSCDQPVFDALALDLEKALYSNSAFEAPMESQSNQLFVDAKIWIKHHHPEHKLEVGDPC
jgi:hypothetical protein